MRVNLSYSVGLQEVLSEVFSLFIREKERFILADQKAMQVLKERFSDSEIENILATIEVYKEALSNLDIRLSEVQQILQGYHNILHPSTDISLENTPEETLNLEQISALVSAEDET